MYRNHNQATGTSRGGRPLRVGACCLPKVRPVHFSLPHTRPFLALSRPSPLANVFTPHSHAQTHPHSHPFRTDTPIRTQVFGAKARAAGYVPHGDVQCAQPPAGKASLHRRQVVAALVVAVALVLRGSERGGSASASGAGAGAGDGGSARGGSGIMEVHVVVAVLWKCT